MSAHLDKLLKAIDENPVLKERVHYLPDYDEQLGAALSIGSHISINNPIVGLEACGTSWMKDMANFTLMISTNDGGIADMPPDNYLEITGTTEEEEIASLYTQMESAAQCWQSDFDLEYWVHKQLTAYLPVISSTRMLKDYLNYLF